MLPVSVTTTRCDVKQIHIIPIPINKALFMHRKPMEIKARMASLDAILKDVLPNFVHPVPTKETARVWFKDIPHFKSNPTAKRGGGPTYYSLTHVEKFLRSRTMGL